MTDLYQRYLPRLYNTTFDYCIEAERLRARGFIPYIYDFSVPKAISASTEFMTGSNTELIVQSGGTYIKCDVKCSNTKDKSSTSGCVRTATAFGIDRYYNYRTIDINTSGVTANSNATTMRELMTCFSKTTGLAGDDAEGNVRFARTTKASAMVVSISSATNRMLTSRVYLPKYWRAKIIGGQVNCSTSGTTSSGVLVYPSYYDATYNYGSRDEDSSANAVSFYAAHNGGSFDSKTWPRVYGNDTTMGKLKFYGKRMNALSETWVLKCRILIWCSKRHHELTAPQQNKMFLP